MSSLLNFLTPLIINRPSLLHYLGQEQAKKNAFSLLCRAEIMVFMYFCPVLTKRAAPRLSEDGLTLFKNIKNQDTLSTFRV